MIKNFDMDTINGVVIRSKSQVRFFVGDSTTTVANSFGIIGGLASADRDFWGSLVSLTVYGLPVLQVIT